MSMTMELLEAGWRSHQVGDLPRAEQAYRQLLQQEPGNAHGWYLLGILDQARGNLAAAAAHFQQALHLRPDFPEAYNRLGCTLAGLGKLDEAIGCHHHALRLRPDFVEAYSNLGIAYLQQKKPAEAEASCRAAVRLRPEMAEAHNNLGLALLEQERFAEGIDCLRRVLQLQPGNAQAHNNLGTALRRAGRFEEAAASLCEALRLQPTLAEACKNLGTVLHDLGRLEEAQASFARALHLRPNHAPTHLDLGNVLKDRGRLEEALAAYRSAIQLKPDYADAHVNLGTILNDQGRLDDAMAAYQTALKLRPGYPEAYLNLGNVLNEQDRLDEALGAFRTAVQVKPDYAEAHLNLGNALCAQGRLEEAITAYRTAVQLQPDAAHRHSNLVFVLHYDPGCDAKSLLEEARRWNQRHAVPLQPFILPHTHLPDPERRLRVGYVSPDFREHATTFFTVSLLSNHDHHSFEVYCYADVRRPDSVTGRLRGHADVWRSTRGLSDEQLAELIRSDRIDILVDLTMHMADNRLLVFARKPAPVQVCWVAYPGTTGLSAIDYRLTDPYLDPPGLFDACYAEESVRLADTFWCYDPLTEPVPINPLPALQNGYVTLGCLNNFCKINDGVLALWAQVLQAVPQARLLLLAPRGQARDGVLARLQQAGIAAERVEFADKRPRRQYLQLYHRVDVALDPFPYNGHTTSLDGFWMGVPTVTLVSQTVVGRAGWSQLCNLGLQELAAQTPEQYVALVAQLAGDLPRLQELRATLRQRMQRSPLMDGPRFARQVEQAYRQMWRRWCSTRQPPG
jgi:predicted O-linked N-acetylglucosamine transferase (SPINDLY family)